MRSMCYVFLFVVQVWCFLSGVLHAMHKEQGELFQKQFIALTKDSDGPINIKNFYNTLKSKRDSKYMQDDLSVTQGQKLLDFIFYKTKKQTNLEFARTVEFVLLAGSFLRLANVDESDDKEHGSGVAFRFVVPLLSLYNELDEVKKIELVNIFNDLLPGEESSTRGQKKGTGEEFPPGISPNLGEPNYQLRVCGTLDKLFKDMPVPRVRIPIALVGGGFLDLFYWSKELSGPGDWRENRWWSLPIFRKEDYNFSTFYKANEHIFKGMLQETVDQWMTEFKTWDKESFLEKELLEQQAAKMKEELLIQQEEESQLAQTKKVETQQSLRERYKTWSKYALGILSIGSVAIFAYWLYRKKSAVNK